MTKFSFNEVGFLLSTGYQRVTDNEFTYKHNDGDYETIVKDADNEFSYYYDVAEYKDDIDRANGNYSEYGLTWDELCELYL